MAGDGYDFDLGTYSRRVTANSEAAALWFNRGLVWCYGFNHEEAIACFETAIERDRSMAMAHWGIAYAIGPNYNKPWAAFDPEDKKRSIERAQAEIRIAAECAAANATPVEKALIAALAERWRHVDEEFDTAHDAYANAMRPVYAAHSDDLDVCTFFAEALMNRTAWKLWDLKTGKPAEGAGTVEARRILETAFSVLAPKGAGVHPGLLHLYVHLMEMSPHPELALNAGDALSDLVPDAGHLRHMPTHIDVLTGAYHDVVARNSAAIAVDRKYLDRAGPLNFYSLYRCHNFHFKVYGAMFLGRYRTALETADAMTATLPRELLLVSSPPMADWVEAFIPMRQHVLIRFGRWRDIIAQKLPDDPDLYCVTTAMMRYARTVAFAATGKAAEATGEREAFLAAVGRVPETRMLMNNTCLDVLRIAEAMLTGEVEYRKGNFDLAFGHLRRAVELDDSLPYDEPWGWMQPTRHALGALLLEQGRADEAETVYRADLGLDGTLPRACQHPDNVWSLHGLHECLTRRAEQRESKLIRQRLDLALARADVPVVSSCYCRLNHAA